VVSARPRDRLELRPGPGERRYDEQAQRLYVELKEGGSGYYSHVPAAVAREFAAAPSIGRFVIQQLRNNRTTPGRR